MSPFYYFPFSNAVCLFEVLKLFIIFYILNFFFYLIQRVFSSIVFLFIYISFCFLFIKFSSHNFSIKHKSNSGVKKQKTKEKTLKVNQQSNQKIIFLSLSHSSAELNVIERFLNYCKTR